MKNDCDTRHVHVTSLVIINGLEYIVTRVCNLCIQYILNVSGCCSQGDVVNKYDVIRINQIRYILSHNL